MIERVLSNCIARMERERFQLHLEAPFHRIQRLGGGPTENLKSLSHNPRSCGIQLTDEEMVWPLEVLSLPSVGCYEEVEQRIDTLLSIMDQCRTDHRRGVAGPALNEARDKVEAAYTFLRWPQNRERIAAALEIAPHLAPKSEEPTHMPAPSMTEWLLKKLHRVVVCIWASMVGAQKSM